MNVVYLHYYNIVNIVILFYLLNIKYIDKITLKLLCLLLNKIAKKIFNQSIVGCRLDIPDQKT